jgi:23S rRNA-/tRNA-specific pseudouridylate synthase
VRTRAVQWLVRPGEGPQLGDVLKQLGALSDGAVEQGRVFVGQRRASSLETPVASGDLIAIYPPRRAAANAVRVIERRGGIVVVDKPPALPTEPDRRTRHCARALLAHALGLPESELHAASRLDLGVSGVVLFAATPQAKGHLAAQRAQHLLQRRYVALAAGAPAPDAGRCEQPVAHAGRTRPAATAYRTLSSLVVPEGTFGPRAQRRATLLALDPLTGRTHQLRQHAAALSAPLLGDRRYGGPERLQHADGRVQKLTRVLLHAYRVTLNDEHGERWTVTAGIPAELSACWQALGGRDVDFGALEG